MKSLNLVSVFWIEISFFMSSYIKYTRQFSIMKPCCCLAYVKISFSLIIRNITFFVNTNLFLFELSCIKKVRHNPALVAPFMGNHDCSVFGGLSMRVFLSPVCPIRLNEIDQDFVASDQIFCCYLVYFCSCIVTLRDCLPFSVHKMEIGKK